MSTINANVADYLTKIEKLTNTNLQILKTLNDSFYTKRNHIFAEVDDATYVIPSFISLENKINALQENFENLIKSPETSEAYFNFDGNTRAIEVRKYSHVPDSITIPTISYFNVENNDIFKDFLTPVPYINIDLPKLPNDIVEVNVKKIVPKSDAAKELFRSKLSYTEENNSELQYKECVNCSYSDIYKNLLNYEEDVDYIEYDTIYKLPIRKNIGTGTYVIESVVSDVINDNLEEIITLKLRNDLKSSTFNNTLTYKVFDETIEKHLQPGDELINFDGTGKVVITEVRQITNTIVVKVVNGEYMNFIGTDSYDTNNDTDIHDLSKLRFHATIDFDKDKTIKVPLEEDKYVFIAVAVLNSRMNVQSSWGIGIILDAHSLTNAINSLDFKSYYNTNVKNIGDVLFEMTSMITSPITELSKDKFERLTSLQPKIDTDIISVMQINKHLNNSETVKNIRDAYNQKKLNESKLSNVQEQINDINAKLSSASFNSSNLKPIYESQLKSLNEEKITLTKSITESINKISINVNSAEIPIENAKYRIRGFYSPNLDNVSDINTNDHIIGIQVQYRYKNTSAELGNATSITGSNGKTYIYSDWNNMNSFNKDKIAEFVNGNFIYKYEDNNENINEPSFNQIDIPISQGESVSIRLRAIYDFGQPYIKMTSAWSEIIEIQFPDEFAKDVPILTIIEENNNDIETNRFNTILENEGVIEHIKNMQNDQNVVYYHKPENISSGFFTEERRIIPLKDKLESMSNDIAQIKSDIDNVNGKCKVSLAIGDNYTTLSSDMENVVSLEAYNNFIEAPIDSAVFDGNYTFNDGIVSTFVNIVISNVGTTAMKLYSLFPGNRSIELDKSKVIANNKEDYCKTTDEKNTKLGVHFKYQNQNYDNATSVQTQNQFVTFRINDVWTGEKYYDNDRDVYKNIQGVQNLRTIETITNEDELAMVVHPYISTQYGLCVESDNVKSCMILNPGEELVIPMLCSYVAKTRGTSISKTISFDLRTSLYTDPVNYSFNIVGKNASTSQDKLSQVNKKKATSNVTNKLYV